MALTQFFLLKVPIGNLFLTPILIEFYSGDKTLFFHPFHFQKKIDESYWLFLQKATYYTGG